MPHFLQLFRACGLAVGALALISSPLRSADVKVDAPRKSPFAAALKNAQSATVFIQELKEKAKDEEAGGRLYSVLGIIIDPKGIVVTNHSLIKGLKKIEVVLGDGRKLPAKAVFSDPDLDLAVIKVEDAKPMPFAEYGDSDKLEVGDRVLALSAPFSFPDITGTVGYIGAKMHRPKKCDLVFVVDSGVSPGIGPAVLVSKEGKFLGLIVNRYHILRGMDCAIPGNRVKDRVAELTKEK
jgi:serine protease Do